LIDQHEGQSASPGIERQHRTAVGD
jgi:hypothetical protein